MTALEAHTLTQAWRVMVLQNRSWYLWAYWLRYKAPVIGEDA